MQNDKNPLEVLKGKDKADFRKSKKFTSLTQVKNFVNEQKGKTELDRRIEAEDKDMPITNADPRALKIVLLKFLRTSFPRNKQKHAMILEISIRYPQLSFEYIAKQVNDTPDNVKKTLLDAKEIMKDCLAKRGKVSMFEEILKI